MSDIKHLVQDLRAEAHTVPPNVARLMRDAATSLEALAESFGVAEVTIPESLADFDPRPVPIPPPDDVETYASDLETYEAGGERRGNEEDECA